MQIVNFLNGRIPTENWLAKNIHSLNFWRKLLLSDLDRKSLQKKLPLACILKIGQGVLK